MARNPRNHLIVALDVPTVDAAKSLIDQLQSTVDIFKIGSQIFTATGPAICHYAEAKGKRIFLDLKFHDIPNTVASAVKAAVSLNVFMMTVHTVGGKEMLEAASKAAREQAHDLGVTRPFIVGVTVLTSTAQDSNTKDVVLERARLAKECGLDGVVASVEEAAAIRAALGKDFIIVTPGIRPADASKDDQKRVATPAVAIKSGSNFLVVGRPIVADPSPSAAALRLLKEMMPT